MTGFNRRKEDQDLGYLMASIEHTRTQLDTLVGMLNKHEQEGEVRFREITIQLQEMRDELNMYKTAIRVAKALGWTAAFILAFKFGDIPDLWKH